MAHDTQAGGTNTPNEHENYNEEENMDRAAQAGVEGAFDADPGTNPIREQMQQDARDAFGNLETGGSSTTDPSPS